MYYAITHLTQFTYSDSISDSVNEIRLCPRTESNQQCLRFNLDIRPKTSFHSQKDYLGNEIHLFNIPGQHTELAIRAESIVDVQPRADLPDQLPEAAWSELETAVFNDRDLYDMTLPSQFTHPTPLLRQLSESLMLSRQPEPLMLAKHVNRSLYENFGYMQAVTNVDSPIDVALEKRQGVCQDFAHIMLALLRLHGIPARYVSGYLFHRTDDIEHADRSAEDATHAWIDAWLPEFGWVGFDPTNNLIVKERFIRVAVGRDYADVPPTKGVFVGDATSSLSVGVKVSRLDKLPHDLKPHAPELVLPEIETGLPIAAQQQQQQ